MRPIALANEVVANEQNIDNFSLPTCHQLLLQRPDLKDDLTLNESDNYLSMPLQERARKCMDGAFSAWKDTIRELLINPYIYMTKTSFEQTKSFLDNCNKLHLCKQQLYYEAYGRTPSDEMNKKLSLNLSFTDLDILYGNAKSRINSTGMQNERLRLEVLNRRWLENKPVNLDQKQENTSFWLILKGLISSEKQKWACLKPEAAQELFCYYLAQIIDPTIAAGMISKTPKLSKLVNSSIQIKSLRVGELPEVAAYHAFGNNRRAVALPENFELAVWNIYKGKKTVFPSEVGNIIGKSDVVLFQEMTGNTNLQQQIIRGNPDLGWSTAEGYVRHNQYTGVATGSKVKPLNEMALRSPTREPIINSPKSILVTDIPSVKGPVRVINVHAINFTTDESFRKHIRQISGYIENYRGPIIVGGDFNTWSSSRKAILNEAILKNGLKKISSANQSLLSLDHVYSRGISILEQTKLSRTKASDHQPIVLQLHID
ncbi:MAG: endonuclease/exonuclease/phosphatase family protein [Bdellovibrionaceae bacterium]|nr:endonuclease/exonuclease/phosphatase family protein [Pseudobdellovibrionaceae bacterium]